MAQDTSDENISLDGNLFFIDTTESLVTEDGYLKYTYDGLHINPKKQADFYANIEKAVKNSK